MSIGIEHFGLHERMNELGAFIGLQRPLFPYRVRCRACGFEPLDAARSYFQMLWTAATI
jgi:hypothetical protein